MFSFDLEVCARVVVCMGHFLWQALIPLGLMLSSERLLRDRPEHRYWLGVVCLLALAACMPLTYGYLASFQHVSGGSTSIFPQPALVQNAVPLESLQRTVDTPTDQLPIELTSLQESILNVDMEVASRSPGLRFQAMTPWILFGYLVGVAYFGLRLCVGTLFTFGLRRQSTAISESPFFGLVEKCAKSTRLHARPLVRWCETVAVPTTIGVVRPMVLLPIHCATMLTIEQIEQVLIHEFHHIRRLDPLVNVFQCVLEALLFFHPSVWYLSRQIRLQRELCCDAAVLRSGVSSIDYASSLMRVATLARLQSTAPCVGIAATGKMSQLQRRIRWIAGKPDVGGAVHVYSRCPSS